MNIALTVSADMVGATFANDPELALPAFPRFPPEVAILPYQGTGLLFDGVRGTQVLNGRGARGFLPRLIARLDGTRTLADIVLDFPTVPRKAVIDAVALLYSRGLLEDGFDPDGGVDTETSSFLGRYVDATRANLNRHQALDRLSAAKIALAGSPAVIEALVEALGDLGGGSIGILTDPEAMGEPDLLIIIAADGDDSAKTWLEAAWRAGVPALHAAVGATTVEVGPLFMPGQSACYGCMRVRRPLPPSGEARDLAFWAGIVALQAHHLISRVGNPGLYNVCHTHELTDQGTLYEDVKLARLPGCADCGLGDHAPSRRDPNHVVWQLHNAANTMPPHRFRNPRDYQMHYAATNLQITAEVAEPWWGTEPVALPVGALPEAPPVWAASEAPQRRALDFDSLATLLRTSVGYHVGEPSRRVAPSAGGLGSAELFLIARQVPGLAAGVYRYNAVAHRLERLCAASDPLVSGALGIPLWSLPPILLVGACNTAKLHQKYNDFTFRFAALDAGVARLLLHDAAASLGIRLAEYPGARDGVLADSMMIPSVGGSYILTFALGLGSAPPLPPQTGLVRTHQYVTRLIALASDLPGAIESIVPPVERAPEPAPAPALATLLSERRSARRFDARPVPAEAALRLAALASAADGELAAEGGLPLRMRVWLAVNHHSGEAAGIYAFDPARQLLVRTREGLVPDDLHALMIQHMLAEAPLVMLITGDFGDAVERFGARGYRDMIVRAGAIAARGLLAAQAEGMQGCPWGGLTEDGWGPLLSTDRYRDCPLFGLSLGYPYDS